MLIGDNIYLRPFQEDDYLLLNKWRNDYEIQKLTCGPIRCVSLEIEHQWVKAKMLDNNINIYWAICNIVDNKMIGYASLNQIDHLNKKAEAGGSVIGDPEYRDGYGVLEAMKLIIDYAFLQLNLNRIYTECLPEHYFAPHSLYSLGFEKEGSQKEAIYKNGRYYDMDLYALMRKDYDALNEKGEYDLSHIIRRCIKHIKANKG